MIIDGPAVLRVYHSDSKVQAYVNNLWTLHEPVLSGHCMLASLDLP